MDFNLRLTDTAVANLDAMDQKTAKQIIKKLVWFAAQPNPLRWTKRLEENASGDFRFRIGDYRAIGVLKKKIIEITKIGHRSEIYR